MERFCQPERGARQRDRGFGGDVRFSLRISDILLLYQEEKRMFAELIIVDMKTILTKEIRSIIYRNGPNKILIIDGMADYRGTL